MTAPFEPFRHAARGLVEAVVRERHMRFHVVSALAVALWGSEVPLGLAARLALVLCTGAVLGAEVLNTALEALVDLHTRERREEARRVKDAAAGAVLVLALGSAAVASIIAGANAAGIGEALRRLGPLVLVDVGVLATGAALVAPMQRWVGIEAALVVLGAVQLVFVTLRSESLPFAAMAWAFFGVACAAAVWSRLTRTAGETSDA